MTSAEPRSTEQRKSDTISRLQQPGVDVWVATASGAPAEAYLVPLSLAWTGDRIVTATEPGSRTARNVTRSGRARLGIGPTRDVVMIDAELEQVIDAAEVDDTIGELYVTQAGWDPRHEPDPFVFIIYRPVRVQAWREANEIAGRTLMRDGRWLI